ncbi:MAG: hypothetical protein KGN79_00795, partial [Acidobacteriota bacterium]|nr:hypothetical protein [Acidobacteriota bacterium]
LFVILGLCTLGSLLLSRKSRGTVTVDDMGVTRQIGEKSQKLRWNEIEGYVTIYAGIALVPREDGQMMVIPRYLDDFGGCKAEIEARGVRNLPPSSMKGCC